MLKTAAMRYGLIFANVGPFGEPDGAAELGAVCEGAGLESIWTVEHVVVPTGYASEYPYSTSGRMAGGEDSPIPDPLVWLTWVAAHTTTLRLATGVLILPQRNPVVLAKEVATLDRLSKGRVLARDRRGLVAGGVRRARRPVRGRGRAPTSTSR